MRVLWRTDTQAAILLCLSRRFVWQAARCQAILPLAYLALPGAGFSRYLPAALRISAAMGDACALDQRPMADWVMLNRIIRTSFTILSYASPELPWSPAGPFCFQKEAAC